MPYRSPNQLLGADGSGADDRGGHPYVYVSTGALSSSFAASEGGGERDPLAVAKQEVRRLKEANKSLEACLKARRPDTSAAWQSEAERLQAELQAARLEQRALVQELATARDTLAHSLSQGGSEAQAAIEAEAARWKERLKRGAQETEELRKELQQALGRCEEVEAARTGAMLELAAERGKAHPRGVDPLEHEGVLRELEASRTRVALRESEAAAAGEAAQAEAKRVRAECQEDIDHLSNLVEEARAALQCDRAAAAATEASLAKLAGEHRALVAEAAALRSEGAVLAGRQAAWEGWSRRAGDAASASAREARAACQELAELRARVKAAEERAEARAGEAQQRLFGLGSSLPPAGATAWGGTAMPAADP